MIMHDIQETVFRASVIDLYNKMLGLRLEVIGSQPFEVTLRPVTTCSLNSCTFFESSESPATV